MATSNPARRWVALGVLIVGVSVTLGYLLSDGGMRKTPGLRRVQRSDAEKYAELQERAREHEQKLASLWSEPPSPVGLTGDEDLHFRRQEGEISGLYGRDSDRAKAAVAKIEQERAGLIAQRRAVAEREDKLKRLREEERVLLNLLDDYDGLIRLAREEERAAWTRRHESTSRQLEAVRDRRRQVEMDSKIK